MIRSGAQRGDNLFHSFEQFSINEGQRVYFNNPAGVERIFSRVTGQLPSYVFGTLGVNGSADLFLLNPNGILFGPNARLDVAGSFTASTADSFAFADGSEFSTRVPETSLLTISVPLGLQFNAQPRGNISNRGVLTATGGQALKLFGYSIYNSGRLEARRGGNVELTTPQTLGSSVLVNGGRISTAVQAGDNTAGGDILITTHDLTVQGNGSLSASTFAVGDTGHIEIRATGDVVVEGDRSLIANQVGAEGVGNSGGISIETNNLRVLDDAAVTASTFGRGNSGPIEIIATGDIAVEGDRSFIANQVASEGVGNSGGISITTNNLRVLDDAAVTASTFGQGNSGSIKIIATGEVGIEGASDGDNDFSSIDSRANSGAVGNGGGISIIAGSLSLLNDAFISAWTSNEGEAGAVKIGAADDIVGSSIAGSSVALDTPGDVSVARIFTANSDADEQSGTAAVSAGGDIEIGGIDTSLSEGQGGDVTLEAGGDIWIGATGIDASGNGNAVNGGQIQIRGEGSISLLGSVDTRTHSSLGSSGDGGAIAIASELGDVVIQNSLSTGSYSALSALDESYPALGESGNGGNITISSGPGDISISGSLNTRSNSFSPKNSSESSNGGNITVSSGSGNVTINSGLESFSYSVSYLGSSQAGNGGAISIHSDSGNVVAEGLAASSFSEASSTTELFSDSSEAGNGGAITVSSNTGSVTVGSLSSFSDSSLYSDYGSSRSRDGGQISVFSQSGDITIRSVSSASYAVSPRSSSESGNGGDITIFSRSGNVDTGDLFSGSSSGSGVGLNASGNGGDITVFSDFGNIQTSSTINSSSRARTGGDVGNGGNTFLSAPKGRITGDETQISTFAIAEAGGRTGAGGLVRLEAADLISGLGILTLSSSGESGNVAIQGNEDSLTLSDLGLITSGQVEIPVLPRGTITLNLDDFGTSGNTSIESSGDLIFNNVEIQADANGSQPAGGVTIISPGRITFTNSEISSNANSTGEAGTIQIDAERLEIGNGGRIFAATSGNGDGGSVIINATDSVFLGEGVQDFEPVISVEASGAGRPGNIFINTPSFVLSETARITATATETATNLDGGGSISLNADQMNLAGIVGIFAETQGQAPGGVLRLQPYQSSPNLDLTFASGAVVSASTRSSGNGGGLEILAPEAITISGSGLLAAETSGSGRGGDIEVASQRLRLAEGVRLSASTTGPGLAGDIRLALAESLEIDGSTITSSTGENSTGLGGSIAVTAPTVALRNGSRLEVNSQGTGQGGRVTVAGNQLILSDNSHISATTLSSDGGDLTFSLQDLLGLRGNSEISTTAGTAGAGGDGGDITIDTQFIVATLNENNDIVANAFDGNGGNVNITTTGGIFGIAPQPERTPQSDITASSRNGVSGDVTVQSPEVDPSQSLVELPAAFIASEVTRSCRDAFVEGSEFVISGRGGLPQSPLDPMTTALWQDVLPIGENDLTDENNPALRQDSRQVSGDASAADSPEATTPPVVEVQGWVRNEKGQVVLVAADPQQTALGHPVGC